MLFWIQNNVLHVIYQHYCSFSSKLGCIIALHYFSYEGLHTEALNLRTNLRTHLGEIALWLKTQFYIEYYINSFK